ncbi:hypothetical protein GGS20DRAFT_37068 [Poronia punctata]|nr:hypothetical protein GGS20DRAFT_37068 [Poronia punctata]
MAFTMVEFPLDKDHGQISFLPDNEELDSTGENLFDQFLTFDPADAAAAFAGDGLEGLEDPQSPSVLLESLQNELMNSSSLNVDSSSATAFAPHAEATDKTAGEPVGLYSQDIFSYRPEALSNLAVDPILGNGSISDSELLRLEGLSAKPIRGNVTAPSTPIFAPSVPSSPRKHSRLVGAVRGTIRRLTHRQKMPKQEDYQPLSLDVKGLDNFHDHRRQGFDVMGLDYGELTGSRDTVKTEPVEYHGLPPLSPPLTDRLPGEWPNSGFVTGHLEDPFLDDVLGPPAIIHRAKRQGNNTPRDTPMVDVESFYHHAMVPIGVDTGTVRRQAHKPHRYASSAEWPTEGLLTNKKYTRSPTMWSSNSPLVSYMPETNGPSDPSWWDGPADEMEGLEVGGDVMQAHNISMHSQQANIPYEYNNQDLAGLMIHMPRPRPPPASILNANLHEHVPSTPMTPSYRLRRTPSFHHEQGPEQHYQYKTPSGHLYRQGHHAERRPRPRAPSSGARRHGSPRKLHHSMSLGALREQSVSPSPASKSSHGHAIPRAIPHAAHQERRRQHHNQHQQQQRSSSLSMRKQRSFTRRSGSGSGNGTSPRTPSSGTFRPHGSTTMNFPSSSGGGSRAGSSFGSVDFVNFTPSDKKVLMNGVAPSGSSKTKARREKEADERRQLLERETEERRRRFEELTQQLVREAGGDVSQLFDGIAL